MSGRSQFYPLARQLFATGALNWTSGNWKILLMANGYIPNFGNQHLSDIPSASIIATSPNIAGQTATNGVLSGDTVDFGTIEDPREGGYLIFYNDTGNPTTSVLLCFVDTPDIPGFPALLQGFTYYVYENVGSGWFVL